MGKDKTEEIKSRLEEALKNSTCLKHPVAVIIYDICGDYVESGWNGPPDFMKHDKCLREGYDSGKGMELCPGSHAEARAISNAAKYSGNIYRGTVYLSGWFPCADCAKLIVDAEIKRLVTPSEVYSNEKERTLVPELRNQPYNFEMAEELIAGSKIEIIVDKSIMPNHTKQK